jgi:hypothetical protein
MTSLGVMGVGQPNHELCHCNAARLMTSPDQHRCPSLPAQHLTMHSVATLMTSPGHYIMKSVLTTHLRPLIALIVLTMVGAMLGIGMARAGVIQVQFWPPRIRRGRMRVEGRRSATSFSPATVATGAVMVWAAAVAATVVGLVLVVLPIDTVRALAVGGGGGGVLLLLLQTSILTAGVVAGASVGQPAPVRGLLAVLVGLTLGAYLLAIGTVRVFRQDLTLEECR